MLNGSQLNGPNNLQCNGAGRSFKRSMSSSSDSSDSEDQQFSTDQFGKIRKVPNIEPLNTERFEQSEKGTTKISPDGSVYGSTDGLSFLERGEAGAFSNFSDLSKNLAIWAKKCESVSSGGVFATLPITTTPNGQFSNKGEAQVKSMDDHQPAIIDNEEQPN